MISDASTSNPHSKQNWTIFQLQGWENTERHSWMMKMSRHRREILARLKQPKEWIDCQADWDSCSETNLEQHWSFRLQFAYLEFELKADFQWSWCAEEAAWPEGLSKASQRFQSDEGTRQVFCLCKCLKKWHLFFDNHRVLPFNVHMHACANAKLLCMKWLSRKSVKAEKSPPRLPVS